MRCFHAGLSLRSSTVESDSASTMSATASPKRARTSARRGSRPAVLHHVVQEPSDDLLDAAAVLGHRSGDRQRWVVYGRPVPLRI